MSTESAKRLIIAMERAMRCIALGARTRTIHRLTGLTPAEIERLLGPNAAVARGRHPDSTDWYHNATLLERAEASLVVVRCCRGISFQFEPEDALLSAYERHMRMFGKAPRISFDRAFDLTAQVCGLWIASERTMSLVTCKACQRDYLSVLTNLPGLPADCPYCALVRRYARDPRLQQGFPARCLPAGFSLDALTSLFPTSA